MILYLSRQFLRNLRLLRRELALITLRRYLQHRSRLAFELWPDTVAEVRDESPSGQSGQMGQEHLPVERAKAAVRANPGASANDIAAVANVGRATAQRAQKLVAAESKAGVKPAEPKPPKPPKLAPKPQKKDAAALEPLNAAHAWDQVRLWLDTACRYAEAAGIPDDEVVAELRDNLATRRAAKAQQEAAKTK